MAALAVEGRDGHLFLTNDTNRVIDQVTGRLLLPEGDVRAWETILRGRRAAFDAVGARSISLLVRNKEHAFRDYLPEDIAWADVTVCDQFQQAGRSAGQAGRLVVPDIPETVDGHPSYSKVDTHWTAYGALYACERLLAGMRDQDPGLSPPARDDIEIRRIEVEGDLGSKMTPPVTGETYRSAPPPDAEEPLRNGVPNIGMVRCLRNEKALNRRRVVLFGNSFANGDLLHVLGHAFSEVFFFFCPNVDFGLVERLRPDWVVVQYLERFLARVPADMLGLSVFDHAAMKIIGGAQNSVQMVPPDDCRWAGKLPLRRFELDEAASYFRERLRRDLRGLAVHERHELDLWLARHEDYRAPLESDRSPRVAPS